MRKQEALLVVVALTLVGAAVRFATLDRQSFWLDELVTVSLVRQGFGDMIDAIPESEATPYAYYVAAWVWTQVFGWGEVGLRSLSALAGAATVPVAYGAGAALVSRRVGLLAAALVCVNPLLIWYAQEARSYALFAFFSALTVLFFGRALRSDQHALVLWAVSSSLALATHYFAIFLVVPEAAWLLARYPRRVRAVLASLLPAATLLVHVPLILEQRAAGEAVNESSLLSRAAGIAKSIVVGYSFPAELAGSAAAAALVVFGLVLLVTRAPAESHRGALLAGALAAVSLVVPLVFAVAGLDFLIARNAIAVVVPAAICVAAGYGANRLGLAAAAVLCVLSLGISLSVSVDERFGRTDWRGAALYLGQPAVERAIVVTPYMSRTLWSPYLPGLREFESETTRVGEIVILGLATEGGFSTGPVQPPAADPAAPPFGFRLAEIERTPTFALIRYRSRSPRPVATEELAGLELTDLQPGLLLQGPAG